MKRSAMFRTVPWVPELEAGLVPEISGKYLRLVFTAARHARERGLSADDLRARARWAEMSLGGAAIRTAVRWGLIP